MYKQDVIVEIAYSLGGRVMSGVSDAGDSGDLSGANKTAREWVMTVGCGKKVGKSVYLNYDGNEKFMSNEMKLAIEDEIRELLLEGEAYCKKLYKKHKKFHKLLSREIEKKFILTRSEILKLWKDYLKQSKKKNRESFFGKRSVFVY
jgi:ATP-dependent Zn protease